MREEYGIGRLDDAARDVRLAAEALDYIAGVDDYDTWIEVGQALACLGLEGLTLWNNWLAGVTTATSLPRG